MGAGQVNPVGRVTAVGDEDKECNAGETKGDAVDAEPMPAGETQRADAEAEP